MKKSWSLKIERKKNSYVEIMKIKEEKKRWIKTVKAAFEKLNELEHKTPHQQYRNEENRKTNDWWRPNSWHNPNEKLSQYPKKAATTTTTTNWMKKNEEERRNEEKKRGRERGRSWELRVLHGTAYEIN